MRDHLQALAKPSSTSRLAAELRQATETVHLRLHHHPMLTQLHETSLSLQGYGTVLGAFHTFYSIWEPRLSRAGLAFAHEATPLDWLAKDFAVLGLQHSPYAAQPENDHAAMSGSEAIGYLYVRQGSTLGGQRISRHIQQQLGLTPGRDQFFFHGFGKRTGFFWKDFLRFLEEAELSGEIDIDAAAASAVSAFENLEAILSLYKPKMD
ncbi:biliverdin-producing heme oxygenase [Allohahella sp. A8]|uniref:biliverdin-producing heme oxygenase n=1 Tax=Allohahella sp. A8 TaxID=3141461 RepID=UPI003A7FFF08